MAAAAISLDFLYKTVEILECSDDLKRTCRGIFKQTAWAAGGTIAGGLIAGPPGALLGCCVGAFIGYTTSENYKSLIQTIKDMTEDEKFEIQLRLQQMVGSSSTDALVAFLENEVNRQLIWQLFKESDRLKVS